MNIKEIVKDYLLKNKFNALRLKGSKRKIACKCFIAGTEREFMECKDYFNDYCEPLFEIFE